MYVGVGVSVSVCVLAHGGLCLRVCAWLCVCKCMRVGGFLNLFLLRDKMRGKDGDG